MAETGRMTLPKAAPRWLQPVTALRIAIIVAMLACWEALAASGLLYRDVVPSLWAIGKALFNLLTVPDMPIEINLFGLQGATKIPAIYWHLYVTFYEIAIGMLIGGLSGLVAGIALGSSRLLRQAYEPLLYYLGPCPKIIFFPVMIMWFGVGPGSKVAMGRSEERRVGKECRFSGGG